MTYRESSFDPNGVANYGKPLRPYNKVQWAGVACVIAGLAVDLAYFAGRLGWTREWIDSPALAMAPICLGIVLVNSRREPLPDDIRRQRMLVVLAAALAFGLALIAILYFKGA